MDEKSIDFNTKKRKNAANDFEKDLFKLMINSIYGKTMENLQNKINVRIIKNEKDFLKYNSRPTYITKKILIRIVLDDGIYTLTYFHKDSVTSCKKIEKNCDDWKILL